MNTSQNFTFSNNFKQLSVKYDKSHECVWSYMNQKSMVPCFNRELMSEINTHQKEIERSGGVIYLNDQACNIKYSVAASLTPSCFNLGGELALMYQLIRQGNKKDLTTYATKCIDILAHRIFRFNVPTITTISLLQGKTLGGGLEAALTSDVVIAERQSLLGFPEILFNLFPGMGAYSLLSRKVERKVADELMLKGKIYTAEQAYDMGLVDVLVEDGEGQNAVYKWIEKNSRSITGQLAYKRVKNVVNPITYEELIDIVNIWVETAFQLSEHDLSIMQRLIQRQQLPYAATEHVNIEKTA